MSFNLDTFMGKYKDFARGYLFYCKIFGAPVDLGPDHSFLVSSASMPQQKIDELKADWQGMEYKVGQTTTFEDFTVKFRCDIEDKIRNAFLSWMVKIHDPQTNIHGNPSTTNGYFGEVALDHLDGKGAVKSTYRLIGAWPTTVGAVTLDYSTKEFITFDVTFKYQYHLVAGVNSGNVQPTGMSLV